MALTQTAAIFAEDKIKKIRFEMTNFIFGGISHVNVGLNALQKI